MSNQRLKNLRYKKIRFTENQAHFLLRIWSEHIKNRRLENPQDKICWWVITELCLTLLKKDFEKPKNIKVGMATIYALQEFLLSYDWVDAQNELEFASLSDLSAQVQKIATNTDFEVQLLAKGR